MHRQDAPLIPPDSPLASGWRADAVALLVRYGLPEMFDVMSAFAELCQRREPDSARDPLDCAAPARRRISQKAAVQSAECRADNRGRSSLWKAFRRHSAVQVVC
jgi:hypothetical protein